MAGHRFGFLHSGFAGTPAIFFSLRHVSSEPLCDSTKRQDTMAGPLREREHLLSLAAVQCKCLGQNETKATKIDAPVCHSFVSFVNFCE